MVLPLMENEYVKVELGMRKKKMRTDSKRDCQVQRKETGSDGQG